MSKGQFFITSTLSADVTYRGFAKGDGDVPVVSRAVTIKGGANVRGKLVTPRGVVTVLSAEDYEVCEQDPVFIAHKDRGHLLVSQTESNPEATASDMENRDESAPIEDGDFDETAVTEVKPAALAETKTASRGRSSRRA